MKVTSSLVSIRHGCEANTCTDTIPKPGTSQDNFAKKTNNNINFGANFTKVTNTNPFLNLTNIPNNIKNLDKRFEMLKDPEIKNYITNLLSEAIHNNDIYYKLEELIDDVNSFNQKFEMLNDEKIKNFIKVT